MNTQYIIICLVIVGSICIPYFLFIVGGKSNVKNIDSKIKDELAKNNLNISESEKWRTSYIAIDEIQKKALFFKSTEPENTIHLMDLNLIKGFEIIEKRRAIKIKDKNDMVLEHLELKVLLVNGEILFLKFYDDIQDQYEDYEMRRIEKWKAILVKTIVKIPEKKVA
ncbi:MAG: hypothetical protein V7767_00730 [Leeuwenhoekiella sp.]